MSTLKGKVVTVFGGSRSGKNAEENEKVGFSPLTDFCDFLFMSNMCQTTKTAFALGAKLAELGAIVCNGAGSCGLMKSTLDGRKFCVALHSSPLVQGAMSKQGRTVVGIIDMLSFFFFCPLHSTIQANVDETGQLCRELLLKTL